MKSVIALLLVLAWALRPESAAAAIFVVDNSGNSGTGTLRQAVIGANASPDASDTIVFTLVEGDRAIQLNSPLAEIAKTLMIDGTTAPGLTILGDGTQIFKVAAGTTTVEDVNLADGGLPIETGARLSFDISEDGEFSEVISEGGALEKRGDAKLILLGANTYTGGTSVVGGALQGNTTSLQGNISNSASVVFDQAVDGTYADVISGAGSVEKAGTALLVLTGANTYTGGTVVSGGTLQGDTSSLQGDIRNDARVVFDQVPDGTYAGSMSGTGHLEKNNAGLLILTGANTYTGGTRIVDGNLQGSASSIPGDVDIAAGSQLIFDQTIDGARSGAITGGGELLKRGAGLLTLSGASSYTGNTTITAGTLRGDSLSLQGNIFNNMSLIFDQSTAGTFGGVISGTGSVEKRGAGTLTITGAQTYADGTTVSSGRLDVDGQLMGAAGATVAAGATLGGTGSVTGLVVVDGTVSPGNSMTPLNVDDVTFNAGSFFEVDVESDGTHDLLTVNDTATIDDATVRVNPGPGNYLTPVTVPILTATTRDGVFTELIPDFAFLDVALDYTDPTVIELTVSSNGETLSDFATTPNQIGVAAGLEAAAGTGSPDLEQVLLEINTLATDEVAPALDAMSGQPLTQFASTGLAMAARFDRGITSRVRGLRWRESDPLLAAGSPRSAFASLAPQIMRQVASQAPVALGPDERPSRIGGWIDGYGVFGDLDGDANTSDVDYDGWGSTLGLDYRLSDHALIGLAGGYASTEADFDAPDGSGDVDTLQGAIYGGYVTPRYYLSLAARYAQNDIETSRPVVFGGISRKARADFDGFAAGAYAETGFELRQIGSMILQPVASISYTHIEQDSYTESGAGSLNLRVKSADVDSFVSGLGVQLHGTWGIGEDTWITPEIGLRWVHEYGDLNRRIEARLSGATTGGAFVIDGAEPSRDSAVIRVAWAVSTRDHLQVFAQYDGVMNSDLLEHSAAVGFRVIW